ncbi:MAG TPA: tRNA lysidine(34) synthetase TilS [Bacteroidales bacterium]|nr:tRNA lysidine(34) synthetase TilS [Bacteroidales bacterium]HPI86273.1 tRNA lysidine(34) synthetase TilS [Bacteroidales bacterium]
MLDEFTGFITDNLLFSRESRILLAVSGGIDSVVMTDLFHQAGYNFSLAHVNFHLRGDESDRDERFVRKLAAHYQAQIHVNHVDTAGYAKRYGISIQVAARDIRYQWFDELLRQHGFDQVATAHHLDDQVETFLINLARGTGIAGLHGIPVRQGKIVRPLLFATRKQIEDYANAHRLDFIEDSSNRSLKYTRNRIRHKIIPELEKINPSFRATLAETINNISDAEKIYLQAIEDTRNSIIDQRGNLITISVSQFFNLAPLKTLAFELLSPFGFNKSNIEDIIGLRDAVTGKEIISPTHRLVKDRELFIIVPRHDLKIKNEYELNRNDLQIGIDVPVQLSFAVMENIPASLKFPDNVALLDLDKLLFPLRLRKWKRGDRFIPFGMSGSIKLSDFFINQKMSKIEKENQWLLCSGTDIVWVIGRRIDDRYKIHRETQKILRISII